MLNNAQSQHASESNRTSILILTAKVSPQLTVSFFIDSFGHEGLSSNKEQFSSSIFFMYIYIFNELHSAVKEKKKTREKKERIMPYTVSTRFGFLIIIVIVEFY